MKTGKGKLIRAFILLFVLFVIVRRLLFHRDVLQKLYAISLLKPILFIFYLMRFFPPGKEAFDGILCKFGNSIFRLQNAFNIQKSSSRLKGISEIVQVFYGMTPVLTNGGELEIRTSLGAKFPKFKREMHIPRNTNSVHFSTYTFYCFLIAVSAVFQNSRFFNIITQ